MNLPFSLGDIIALITAIGGVIYTLASRRATIIKARAEASNLFEQKEKIRAEADLAREELITKLQQQTTKLTERVNTLTAEKDIARQAEGALREELQRIHRDVEAYQEINTNLSRELGVVRGENAVHQKRLIEKEDESKGLRAIIIEKDMLEEEFRTTIMSMTHQIQMLVDKIKGLESDTKRLKIQTDGLENEKSN